MDTQEALKSFNLDPQLFYDAVAFSTDDYLYVVDMTTDRAFISENMKTDFEFPSRLIDGLIPRWREFIVERDVENFDQSIVDMLTGKVDSHNLEYQIRNTHGDYLWVRCRGLLKRDLDGNPLLFAGVVTNLQKKGKIDAITGLLMHDACMKAIDHLLALDRSTGGILLLGLDDFSRINSLNDHAFGDAVLRKFAQDMQRILPEDISIFRLDGDQFAIVADRSQREDMEALFNAVHTISNRKQAIDDIGYFCTVSGGIVMIGQDGHASFDLIKHAESALEESKHRGKNTLSFFSPAMTNNKLRRLELSDRLQASTHDNMRGFSLYFQPLVDAGSMKLGGAEALLRWSCDGFGSVSPMEFVPVLESYGLIGQVGRWVLKQAITQCAAWCKSNPDFIININISYLQLLENNFVSFVERILKEAELEPHHIVLEITESYFVTDMEGLRSTFEHLRNLGIRLAMDDFGTGYSSLGLLSQSPADIVKIDRLFIKNIHQESFNRAFIDSVIALCHSVGIKVTVEGVEEEIELDTVRAIGADTIQGFFVSRPIPADEFETQFINQQPQEA